MNMHAKQNNARTEYLARNAWDSRKQTIFINTVESGFCHIAFSHEETSASPYLDLSSS